MKLRRNLFIIYLMICFENIDSRSHVKNNLNSGASPIQENSQSMLKETDETSSKDIAPIRLITKHTLKKNVNEPIEVLSNPLIVTNSDGGSKNINRLVFSKPKKLSMKVDGHLVKVSSSLHSKQLDIKRKDGGYEVPVNPKFSHVIEIIPEELLNEDYEELDPVTITKDSLDNEDASSTQILSDLTSDSEFSGSTRSELCIGESCFKNPTDSKQDSDMGLSTESDTKENLRSQLTHTTTLDQDLVSDEITNPEDTIFEFHENEQQVAFNDDIEGSGEEFNSKDVEGVESDPKSGRLLSFLSQRNISSPNCTTPKGEKGQCRRISQCLLSDALNNFNVFLNQLCLIRGVMVGVCCPDNPVIEISNPDDNSTESTALLEEIKQPPEGCGLNTKTRIVGGTISLPHEWTWMVALMRRNRFYCGGVIINNWYILTAAHCVMGMQVKDLTVRLGEYDFNEHNKHQEDISVSEIKRHAQFVTLTFQHDIALLKLKRSIRYSKFVGSICLPTQKARDYSDAKGTVVGWGTVSFGGAASPILRQITVPVWKNEDCDQTYLLENINEAFMCAGSPEKGEDACQGDSGGPLMTINERGRWEVIGIVSWGRRCGDPKYPGVYTRVTTYLDWINQNII